MLTFENLSRHYGAKRAVDGVTLDIPRGAFVGVIGRSGAGKSTLLRMVNRLATPSAGRIAFDGLDVTTLRGAGLRAWRARCAMIFQQFNLVGRMDVLTNVILGRLNVIPAHRAMLKLWRDEDRALALAALERLDIASLATQRADQLSGGQQQRVAIARALMQNPDIILADEPIASLDPRNTRLVMDGLAAVNREYGITVLCNLHSIELARAYCHRLIGMAHGRVVFDGCPDELTDAVIAELYGMDSDETRAIPPRPAAHAAPATGFAPRGLVPAGA
ncbi:phosphonate ABC transporter ATP-binding protein [Camelimonas sp. ID_303_24]